METYTKDTLEFIKKGVISDSFTPKIKSEVIFDMLLEPVILEVIKVGLDKKEESFSVDLIAKEFPLLNEHCQEDTKEGNNSQEKKRSYRNFNVDYLVRNNENKTWYLVELKTTESSEGDDQRKRYIELIESNVNIYKEFKELLLHIYGKKYGSKNDSLKSIFEKIVGKNSNQEEFGYKAAAIRMLKEETKTGRKKYSGSKKYIYTAAQLLEKGIGEDANNSVYEKLKLLYITPTKQGYEEKESEQSKDDEENPRYISLKKIIENEEQVSELLKDNEEKRGYWKWLVGVLKECHITE